MAIIDGKIRCSDCKQWKLTTDFSPYIAKRGCGQCKKCKHIKKRIWEKNNPEKHALSRRTTRAKNRSLYIGHARNWYQKNKDRFTGYSLKKLYGLTLEGYNALLSKQNNLCACCGSEKAGKTSRRFFVDHCHKTGNIRGLLCYYCNTGLGAFGDSLDGILKALIYLRRFHNDVEGKQEV